ncbi:photosystem II biogenesis protein Psp29 [Leptolyngbya sp. FACHB-36]|uniref:photosystem II biogenesis protein Psp29 n=1 Tax=Leptolyngbya sp. FACHB-36 TaxID=2692808 RepID=UPI00168175A3|nr:photosystem II biogenesis protein Psp29 [Leptolyngbya sp. FACHB-36]
MNNVRTVSDTKRAFYTTHTRPINSIYRRVVEELMVEMHLLAVHADFRYDPFYALGVVTSFDRFMQGYRPEQDKASIFEGLCRALQDDPQRYRQDAERLQSLASRLSGKELVAWLSLGESAPDANDLQEQLRGIAHNAKFKYSRLFAIGLFTLVEQGDADLVKDETQRVAALKQICTALNLPEDKLQKDLDLYRSNLEKMAQARIVMEDALKAERKKREEREKAKAVTSAASDASEPRDEAASEP